jgi:hypothetical protein
MGKKAILLNLEKGLDKGALCPPPLLFNVVGDVLTSMLKKAVEKNHLKGLLEELVPWGAVTPICR